MHPCIVQLYLSRSVHCIARSYGDGSRGTDFNVQLEADEQHQHLIFIFIHHPPLTSSSETLTFSPRIQVKYTKTPCQYPQNPTHQNPQVPPPNSARTPLGRESPPGGANAPPAPPAQATAQFPGPRIGAATLRSASLQRFPRILPTLKNELRLTFHIFTAFQATIKYPGKPLDENLPNTLF